MPGGSLKGSQGLSVEWSRHARADLLEILDYISDEDPAAAWRLRDELYQRLSRLGLNPRLYRSGREPGTREMVFHPSYMLVYAVHIDAIKVLRILHTARQWPAPNERAPER